MFLLLLVLCCILWGCADPAQPPPLTYPSKAEMQPSIDALRRCYHQKVVTLDDGISDARTIALALSQACWTVSQASFELYGRNLSPGAKAMFVEKSQANTPNLALPVVLDYRKWKQEQQR